MKFQKPKNHRQWTSEETQERLDRTNSEISYLCRDLNMLDSMIATLRNRKEGIQRKVSNKVKYVNQLEAQLEETLKKESSIKYYNAPFFDIEIETESEPCMLTPDDSVLEASGSLLFTQGPTTHSRVYHGDIKLDMTHTIVSTVPKNFKGEINPTGSNSYGSNVQRIQQ